MTCGFSLRTLGVCLLLLPLLAACSTKSHAEEIASSFQSIQSWAATAHMAGDAWAHGSVPDAYASQTLDQAAQNIKDTIQSLSSEEAVKTPVPAGGTLQDHLQRLRDIVKQMPDVVAKGYRSVMVQHVSQLAAEEQALNDYMNATGNH